MGCGASSAAPLAPVAHQNATAGARKPGKPRTRRASVEIVDQADRRTEVEGQASSIARNRSGSVQAVEDESSEDEIVTDGPSRLQPKSVAQQRQDRRRGSVEQEHAALAAAAAAAAASSAAADEQQKRKSRKKKSKAKNQDFILPSPGLAAAADLKDTKLSDLKVIAVLGVGTFSRVSLVKHKRTKKTYALKRMDKATIDQLKQKRHIMNEKSILQEMNHPFIIKLYATFKDPVSLYMITEPVLGGELFSVLTREEYLDEDQTRFYVGCIVLALEDLHNHNNIYRDLKPENILLDSDGYVKVCDFGFAKKLQTETTKTTCGTPEYVSPEMLSSKDGHGEPTDWWCVGILIYECLFATTPFAADDYAETYRMIDRYASGKRKIDYTCDGISVDSSCKLIIGGLLEPDPSRRLGAAAIKRHDWFKKLDWVALFDKSIPAPWKPIVRSAEDTSNFESEDYGADNPSRRPYKGDPEWFADF